MLTSSVTSMAQWGDAGGRAEGTQDLSRLASASPWDVDVGNIRFQEAQWGGVGAVILVKGHRGRTRSGEEARLHLRPFKRPECLAQHPGTQHLSCLHCSHSRDRQALLPTSIAKAMGMRKEVKEVQVRGSGDRVGTLAGGLSASEGSLCLGEP